MTAVASSPAPAGTWAELFTAFDVDRAGTAGVPGGDGTVRLSTGRPPQPEAYPPVGPALGGRAAFTADLRPRFDSVRRSGIVRPCRAQSHFRRRWRSPVDGRCRR